MKKKTRILTLISTLITGIFLFGSTVIAGGGQSNLNLTASSVQVQPGWTEYVSINNNPMTISAFTGGFIFDPAIYQVTNITVNNESIGIVSTLEEANAYGTVGFAIINLNDYFYDAGNLLTVELVALNEGIADFCLYEDSDGTDGFKADNVGTITTEVSLAADGSAQGAAAGVTDYMPNAGGGQAGTNVEKNQGTGAQSADGKDSGGSNGTSAANSSGKKMDEAKKNNSFVEQKIIWPYAVGAGVTLAILIALFVVLRRAKKNASSEKENGPKADGMKAELEGETAEPQRETEEDFSKD